MTNWRDREGGLWVSVPPGGPDPETHASRILRRQMDAGVAAFERNYGPHGLGETLMAVYRAMVDAAQPGWNCFVCKGAGRIRHSHVTHGEIVAPCPTCRREQ